MLHGMVGQAAGLMHSTISALHAPFAAMAMKSSPGGGRVLGWSPLCFKQYKHAPRQW